MADGSRPVTTSGRPASGPMPSPGTLKALTDVALYEIDEKVCAAILARRPIIAEKLAEILAQRSQAGTPADSPDHKQQRGARVFLNAIQTILRA
jgi:CRP-like cAMP-binding protein